ncbi:7462_t:CDS:1, partial [Funneliformis geosporum]
IKSFSLKILMHKVKAHYGVDANEKVDAMAKDALHYPALHLIPSDKSHSSLYLQQYAIAIPLRLLIKDMTHSKHLVSFLNLDLNHKYIYLNVNLIATIFYISDNVASSSITFEMSSIKMKKLQR